MCVSKGAPKKPAYGPCNETHGKGPSISTYGGPTITWNGYGGTTTAGSSYSTATWYSITTANNTTAGTGWITV